MATYRTEITTARPCDQVFSDLARFDHAAEWDPGVDAATMLTLGPVGLGARFALETRALGRTIPLEYEIVEFEPDARVVLRADHAAFRSIDTITVAELPGGALTVVTYVARLEPKGVARLAAPLFAAGFRLIGDRAARGLRQRLEAVDAP